MLSLLHIFFRVFFFTQKPPRLPVTETGAVQYCLIKLYSLCISTSRNYLRGFLIAACAAEGDGWKCVRFCHSCSTDVLSIIIRCQAIRSTSKRLLLYVLASTTETLQFNHFNFFSMLSWILCMVANFLRTSDSKFPSGKRTMNTDFLPCGIFSSSNAVAYGISSSAFQRLFFLHVYAPSKQEIVIDTLCATSLSRLSLPVVSTVVGAASTFALSIAIRQRLSLSCPKQSFTSSNSKKPSVSHTKSTPFAPGSLLNRFR